MSTIRLIPTAPPGPGLTAQLVGEDVLTGGVGGWQPLERPLRREAVEYVGTPGFLYELPLLLNGVDVIFPGRNLTIEGSCKSLLRWGNRSKATGKPQILRLTGSVLKTPPSTRWVIDTLAWGESWLGSAFG